MSQHTTNIDAASDRAFKSDLNHFLNEQANAEHRAELAEKLAQFLLDKNEEYHPWTFAHFEEALSNASAGERQLVWACIVEAIEAKADHQNHLAISAIREIVNNYWHKLASEEAIKRIQHR